MMKKIVKSCIFCMPVLLFIGLFLLYEPYNYFGLRSERGDCANTITVMREIINSKSENIIIGHSKVALLETKDLITAGITEEEWCNMAVSGATLNEQCDLFWFANEHSKIEKVDVVLSFYSTHIYAGDRVNQTRDLAKWENYVFNPQSYKTAFELCKEALLTPNSAVEYTGKTYSAETKQPLIDDYVKRIWVPFASNYTFNYEGVAELIDVIVYCKENGIEISVYALPMRGEIYEALENADVLRWVSFYKRILSGYTTVYDMEYPENVWSESYDYIEGCHFEGIDRVGERDFEEEYPMLYDSLCMMFQGTGEDYTVWQDAYPETKQILEEASVSLSGTNELVVWSRKVEVKSGKVYELSYTGGDFADDADIEIFYMDLYGVGYDGSRQNFFPVTLQHNGTKWAVVFSDKVPENTDIYFRIIYKGTENVTIDDLVFSELICE